MNQVPETHVMPTLPHMHVRLEFQYLQLPSMIPTNDRVKVQFIVFIFRFILCLLPIENAVMNKTSLSVLPLRSYFAMYLLLLKFASSVLQVPTVTGMIMPLIWQVTARTDQLKVAVEFTEAHVLHHTRVSSITYGVCSHKCFSVFAQAAYYWQKRMMCKRECRYKDVNNSNLYFKRLFYLTFLFTLLGSSSAYNSAPNGSSGAPYSSSSRYWIPPSRF